MHLAPHGVNARQGDTTVSPERSLLGCNFHFLITLPRFVLTDSDSDFPVEPFQKIEQLVRGKAAKVAVHQVGDLWLRDTEKRGNLPLLEIFVFEDCVDMKADLRPRQKLVGIFQPEVSIDVAAALFIYDFSLVFLVHVPHSPLLSRIAA